MMSEGEGESTGPAPTTLLFSYCSKLSQKYEDNKLCLTYFDFYFTISNLVLKYDFFHITKEYVQIPQLLFLGMMLEEIKFYIRLELNFKIEV